MRENKVQREGMILNRDRSLGGTDKNGTVVHESVGQMLAETILERKFIMENRGQKKECTKLMQYYIITPE